MGVRGHLPRKRLTVVPATDMRTEVSAVYQLPQQERGDIRIAEIYYRWKFSQQKIENIPQIITARQRNIFHPPTLLTKSSTV